MLTQQIASLRLLDMDELAHVFGGLLHEEQEQSGIVVTGTRFTEQQKDAYDAWHNTVYWGVWGSVVAAGGAFAVGTAGLGGIYLGAVGGLAAGTVIGNSADDINNFIDDIVEEMWRYDGSDGTYDGPYGGILN